MGRRYKSTRNWMFGCLESTEKLVYLEADYERILFRYEIDFMNSLFGLSMNTLDVLTHTFTCGK